jgi:DNA-binding transcriptional MerR regulator
VTDSESQQSWPVAEVARLIGVSSGTLRLWESQGLTSPSRDLQGRRRYTRQDIQRLRQIRMLRRIHGLNAPAIRRMLDENEQLDIGDAAAPPSGSTRPVSGAPTADGLQYRRMRKQAGFTLKQVSERSGLSVSFISSVERGVSSMSSTAQVMLVTALRGGEPIELQPRTPVHSLGSGPQVDVTQGVTFEWLSGKRGFMEPQLAVLEPGAKADEDYQHDGEEFLLVLTGAFTFWLNGDQLELGTRESIHFSSQEPHRWANTYLAPCEVLWVNADWHRKH